MIPIIDIFLSPSFLIWINNSKKVIYIIIPNVIESNIPSVISFIILFNKNIIKPPINVDIATKEQISKVFFLSLL